MPWPWVLRPAGGAGGADAVHCRRQRRDRRRAAHKALASPTAPGAGSRHCDKFQHRELTAVLAAIVGRAAWCLLKGLGDGSVHAARYSRYVAQRIGLMSMPKISVGSQGRALVMSTDAADGLSTGAVPNIEYACAPE